MTTASKPYFRRLAVLLMTLNACGDIGSDTFGFGTTSTSSDSSSTSDDPPEHCGASRIENGNFEGEGGWSEVSLNYPSVICDSSCDGMTNAYAGEHFVWFGGSEHGDRASITQSVDLPDGTIELSFVLRIDTLAEREGDDALTVHLGDRVVFHTTEAEADQYTRDQEVIITTTTRSGPADLVVEANLTGQHLTSFFIDNIALRACDTTTPLPSTTNTTSTSGEGSESSTDTTSSSSSSTTGGEESSSSSSTTNE